MTITQSFIINQPQENKMFINREEYIFYRKEWKANYKKLSNKIRETKLAIKHAFRGGLNAGKFQNILSAYKADATKMLEELKEAKIKAHKQYMEKKECLN